MTKLTDLWICQGPLCMIIWNWKIVCARWILNNLTETQKDSLVKQCKENFHRFNYGACKNAYDIKAKGVRNLTLFLWICNKTKVNNMSVSKLTNPTEVASKRSASKTMITSCHLGIVAFKDRRTMNVNFMREYVFQK